MHKKNIAKIVILFFLIVAITGYGIYMYRNLSHNSRVYDANVYDYIPVHATQVLNINRDFDLRNSYAYDTTFRYLLNPLRDKIIYPIVISKNKEGDLVTTRVNNEKGVKAYLESIDINSAPKTLKYKDTDIFIYSLKDGKFITCAFYKGLFIACKNYLLLQDVIDENGDSSFFSLLKETKGERIKHNTGVGIYFNEENKLLTLNMDVKDTGITFNGFIIPKDSETPDSLLNRIDSVAILNGSPYYYINHTEVDKENNDKILKVVLNKKR